MYDLAILGAGAAGIACAKRAIKAGLKTVLIQKEKGDFGGTCLNYGCIPTKLFINSAKLDKTWSQIYASKENLLSTIKDPLLKFLEQSGVSLVWSYAKFLDKNTLEAGKGKIEAKNIVIATGSLPKNIFSHPKVITTNQLFNLPELGDRILIIGAGYIGMELSCLLKKLGKDVTVIEKEKNILPGFDPYLSKRLSAILGKKGLVAKTGVDAGDFNFDDFDHVISAVGRVPCSDDLNLGGAGVLVDESGWITTNENLSTNIKNIYACGDVTGKKLLAYVGEYQAKICIDNILGKNIKDDYSNIPECVFSMPAVAKVGILEQEAKALGINFKMYKSNFLKFSSSYVYNDSDGFIQIVVDQQEKIIGAGVISKLASELIATLTLCVKKGLKISDLEDLLLVHPTLSEIIPLLVD